MQHIILYSEIIALIVGLLVVRCLRPGHLKLFVVVLFLIVSTEISAIIMRKFDAAKGFVPQLYNIMLPLQFSFYFYIFLKEIKHWVWRSLLLLLAIVYLIFVFIVLLQQSKRGFNTMNYAAGSVLLSIYSLRYIYQQLSENASPEFWNNLLFYVAVGMVVFYTGTLPFHAMRNYLYDNHPGIFNTYLAIFHVLGVAMYLIFAFGLYKAADKRKSTLITGNGRK
jgi:hypothetical protein